MNHYSDSLLYWYSTHTELLSFPTRRSSDLPQIGTRADHHVGAAFTQRQDGVTDPPRGRPDGVAGCDVVAPDEDDGDIRSATGDLHGLDLARQALGGGTDGRFDAGPDGPPRLRGQPPRRRAAGRRRGR